MPNRPDPGAISRRELIRALREADAPEDAMATEDDLLRYEGRAEAVGIMRDMLGFHLCGHLDMVLGCGGCDPGAKATPDA